MAKAQKTVNTKVQILKKEGLHDRVAKEVASQSPPQASASPASPDSRRRIRAAASASPTSQDSRRRLRASHTAQSRPPPPVQATLKAAAQATASAAQAAASVTHAAESAEISKNNVNVSKKIANEIKSEIGKE